MIKLIIFAGGRVKGYKLLREDFAIPTKVKNVHYNMTQQFYFWVSIKKLSHQCIKRHVQGCNFNSSVERSLRTGTMGEE